MTNLQEIVAARDWRITIEVDPNAGGDGTRVRFFGDAPSFRRMAAIFTVMANAVEDPGHPAAQSGWHLLFNPEETPQFQIKNASFLSLNCSPSAATR